MCISLSARCIQPLPVSLRLPFQRTPYSICSYWAGCSAPQQTSTSQISLSALKSLNTSVYLEASPPIEKTPVDKTNSLI